jgi:hypothetical protein
MKKMLFLMGGFCIAAAGFLLFGAKRIPPVEILSHQLETAWKDHNTAA